MHYHIVDIAIDRVTKGITCIVEMWDSSVTRGQGQPRRMNSFTLVPRTTEIITDRRGFLQKLDGSFVNPRTLDDSEGSTDFLRVFYRQRRRSIRDIVKNDLEPMIKNYYARAVAGGYPNEHWRPLDKSATDPNGLDTAETRALKDKEGDL